MITSPQEQKFVTDFFEALRENIIVLQAQKDIVASGKSAEGLEVAQPDEDIWQLLDTEGYFEQQEYGRGPTRGTGGGGGQTLQQRIYDWLEFKKYGLNYNTVSTGAALRGKTAEKSRLSLSWAIATKIHKLGTRTFQLKSQTGVLTEVINEKRFQSLAYGLRRFYAEDILSDIVKEFRSS